MSWSLSVSFLHSSRCKQKYILRVFRSNQRAKKYVNPEHTYPWADHWAWHPRHPYYVTAPHSRRGSVPVRPPAPVRHSHCARPMTQGRALTWSALSFSSRWHFCPVRMWRFKNWFEGYPNTYIELIILILVHNIRPHDTFLSKFKCINMFLQILFYNLDNIS